MHSYMAPCKINLNLRILGKREDGFHEVDTLMAPLSLHDEIRFTPSNETSLFSNIDDLPMDDSNLVIKALHLFENQIGKKLNYQIELIKNIPHGAGLGGGSSDAAATLMALNEMEKAGFTQNELASMCAGLGSDVAFFIYGGICRCTGRGEIVVPQPGLSHFRANIMLIKPGFAVSTPDAYKRWGASGMLPGISYSPQHYADIEFVNDLEKPVFEKYMFLAEIKEWLLKQKGVLTAMMSGSGSTMFAIVESLDTGRRLARAAKDSLDPTLWTWTGLCSGESNLD